MRFESALKVVRLLKTTIGQPLSIRGICQGIDLSYQPTYKHVRALEREGVIRTQKQGREVRCELAASAATSLWLGLVSVAERRELVAAGGELAEAAAAVVQHARAVRTATPPIMVLLPPSGPHESSATLIAVTAEDEHHLLGILGASISPTIRLQALTEEAFRRRMERPFQRYPLLAESVVLSGEQRFWDLAFADETPGPEPAPAEPIVRPRRRRRSAANRTAGE
ncbi:MAG: winged helix-turn-helix domain-containing protein [Armatimonadota bacterium]